MSLDNERRLAPRIDEWGDYHSPNICFGKSAPSPPAAPDPNAVAGAQSAANVKTAAAQAALNNVNQVTPYGNSTFDPTGSVTVGSTGDGSGGPETVPTYTQTVTLPQAAQTAVTNEQQLAAQLSGLGAPLANNISTAPLNFNSLPSDPTSLGALPPVPTLGTPAGDAASNAAYQAQYQLVAPQLAQQREQTENAAQNAGIPQDSEAWQNMEKQLTANEAQVTDPLAANAVSLGQQEGLNTYNATTNTAAENAALQAAARQQGISEQITQQNQPINQLAALLQGAPAIGMPQVSAPAQTGIAPTDLIGANALSQGAKNVGYQGQVAQASSGNNALAGLGGAGLTGAAILF